LATDHHVTANGRATSDANLRNQDAVLSHSHIVGNLDEIVDFGALFDDSPTECGTVDRYIGSQLNVIFNDDTTELGDLMMSALMLYVSKAVGSDHGSTVHDHSRPK
jgi:hypothetical protein